MPKELCSISNLDETILVDMETSVLGEIDQASTQSFDEVQDSESKISGDNSGLSFCGPRVYSIVNSPSYIQLDEETRVITLSTENEEDIGQFEVEFLV